MRNPHARVSSVSEFISNSGDTDRIEYSARLMPNGNVELCEVGRTNISAEINSYKDCTDISYILSRLAAGDTSVVNVNELLYGDFTKVPHSPAEAAQMLLDIQHDFASLPVDVRAAFDYDVNKYIEEAGSDSWLKKVGALNGYSENGSDPGTESSSELGSSTPNGYNTNPIKEIVSEVLK